MKNQMNKIISIVNKAYNLEKELKYERSINNSVPLDNFLNRCLLYMEKIDLLSVPSKHRTDKYKAKKIVYNIYNILQKYKGTERQDYNFERTLSINSINLEDQHDSLKSATQYSGGGMGFAHVNWNHALFMSTHSKSEKPINHYWRPPMKPAPVVSVPKEEWNNILNNMEEERIKNNKLTMEEWRLDMENQKKDVLKSCRELH
jgi:hypothetical protein